MGGSRDMSRKIIYSKCIYDGVSDEPFEGGVVFENDRILDAGSREALKKYEDGSVLIDVGDKMVMPGMFENHMHFFSGATALSEYCRNDLLLATSEEECARMMKEYRDAHPGLSKYVGNGWLTITWGNAGLPTKRSLDQYFPDVPVYMIAADSHSIWLNSKALEEFETDEISPNVVRFPDGELTGVFKEGKATDMLGVANEVPVEKKKTVQENLIHAFNSLGITSAGEMSGGIMISGPEMYDELEALEQEDRLTVRMFLYSGILDTTNEKGIERVESLGRRFHSDRLRSTGFKIFADGVSATFTAAMLEPYTDKPDTCGALDFSAEDITGAVVAANMAGYPVRIHACGDYAVRVALDAFEEAKKKGASSDLRNAVEHIDIMHPDDIKRFQELNVTASVQPCHVPQDAGEKIIRNGLERCRYEWPFRSLADAGAVLALGTDFPVETFNPFKNIYMALTRCDLEGNCTCPNPEEAITLAEALKGYTANGAYLHGMEDELGTLTPGKYADIVVLDRNLFETPVEEIKDTQVVFTYMNGKLVYEK